MGTIHTPVGTVTDITPDEWKAVRERIDAATREGRTLWYAGDNNVSVLLAPSIALLYQEDDQ